MYCENSFCIYWSKYACMVEEITLDINGMCEACIYIELDDVLLEFKRNEVLHRLDSE